MTEAENHTQTGQDSNLKFEDALAELEKIVSKMEKGELTLQQMMQKFEEGMKLAKYCSDKLNETEKKIEVLMQKTGDEEQWQEIGGVEELANRNPDNSGETQG